MPELVQYPQNLTSSWRSGLKQPSATGMSDQHPQITVPLPALTPPRPPLSGVPSSPKGPSSQQSSHQRPRSPLHLSSSPINPAPGSNLSCHHLPQPQEAATGSLMDSWLPALPPSRRSDTAPRAGCSTRKPGDGSPSSTPPLAPLPQEKTERTAPSPLPSGLALLPLPEPQPQ